MMIRGFGETVAERRWERRQTSENRRRSTPVPIVNFGTSVAEVPEGRTSVNFGPNRVPEFTPAPAPCAENVGAACLLKIMDCRADPTRLALEGVE